MNMEGPRQKVEAVVDDSKLRAERKRRMQEKIAENVGMTVEQYCEYYGLKEIPV